jgi:hypothetical protein
MPRPARSKLDIRSEDARLRKSAAELTRLAKRFATNWTEPPIIAGLNRLRPQSSSFVGWAAFWMSEVSRTSRKAA